MENDKYFIWLGNENHISSPVTACRVKARYMAVQAGKEMKQQRSMTVNRAIVPASGPTLLAHPPPPHSITPSPSSKNVETCIVLFVQRADFVPDIDECVKMFVRIKSLIYQQYFQRRKWKVIVLLIFLQFDKGQGTTDCSVNNAFQCRSKCLAILSRLFQRYFYHISFRVLYHRILRQPQTEKLNFKQNTSAYPNKIHIGIKLKLKFAINSHTISLTPVANQQDVPRLVNVNLITN